LNTEIVNIWILNTFTMHRNKLWRLWRLWSYDL